MEQSESDPPEPALHQRRTRYRGKNPRRFEEKYKERDPERYRETVSKVLAAGKTPAGSHRPIMVAEMLAALAPQPGESAVDCTLGYGGHARALLERLQPGGYLLGLDADPIELPRTEERLRGLGYGSEVFSAYRSNFAGLPRILGQAGASNVDIILADLGVSSMQLDDPARGFSLKAEGPLDLRMNPLRGEAASEFLQKVTPEQLARLLKENADEPHAFEIAQAVAGKKLLTTTVLSAAVRKVLAHLKPEERELSVRRVFQALRIVVNDEFSALEMFLRVLPLCLKSGGRVAILTFHSGEDRRVKRAFEAGLSAGHYNEIARDVVRPSSAERYANPRSTSAKLRWAVRA